MPKQHKDIPLELESILNNEIGNDEKVLWSAQPNISLIIKKEMPAFKAGLFTCALPVIMAAVIYSQGEKIPTAAMVMISLLFLLGLLFVTSPYFAVKKAKKTLYAITGKRAIVIVNNSEPYIESYGQDKFKDVAKTVGKGGGGNLIFEKIILYKRSKRGTKTKVKKRGFIGIDNVADVEKIIIQIDQQ